MPSPEAIHVCAGIETIHAVIVGEDIIGVGAFT
jgi:hypothetical protein